jgi:hypothetical protein
LDSKPAAELFDDSHFDDLERKVKWALQDNVLHTPAYDGAGSQSEKDDEDNSEIRNVYRNDGLLSEDNTSVSH